MLADLLRDRLRVFPSVQLSVLFGSVARGEAGARSDIDVGLLLEPYSTTDRFAVEAELQWAAGRPVDVVLLDDAPPLLRFEIARDGLLLFEREAGLWVDFKARAMVDWWDWAPHARQIQRGVAVRLREQVHGAG